MTTNQPPRKRPPTIHKKHWWLWAGIVAIIALALGIAVWSASGGDSNVPVGTASADKSKSSPAESQPVTVVGSPLPKQVGAGVDESATGLTPPTLQGFTFSGTPIDITPGGKAKMVVFMAHWCPHCNNEIPVIERWAASGGLPAGVDIIGVSTGVSAQAAHYPPSKWIVQMKWKWPVLADSPAGDAAVAYGVGGYPTMVIVGADGKVKARASAELAETELDGFVAKALAG